MKKTLPVYTAPFSNEHAMNTASVHAALMKTMLVASLLNRGLNNNAHYIRLNLVLKTHSYYR